jgi:hypothetical protein
MGGLRKRARRHVLPLTQIDRANLANLKVAWEYHTGDIWDGTKYPRKSEFESTPILVDGMLYLTTAFNRVVALNPVSGKERWSFDPKINLSTKYSQGLMNRGVATWLDTKRKPGTECLRRIFLATIDARLIAMDATSGRTCNDFGTAARRSCHLRVCLVFRRRGVNLLRSICRKGQFAGRCHLGRQSNWTERHSRLQELRIWALQSLLPAASSSSVHRWTIPPTLSIWTRGRCCGLFSCQQVGQATPMTYQENGRQYVVISAGGHGKLGTTLGDSVIAFACPDWRNYSGPNTRGNCECEASSRSLQFLYFRCRRSSVGCHRLRFLKET